MPIKNAHRTAPAYQHYKQISYENLAASWFTADGWEVFMPVTDHDRKTDLVVADDNHYYRIQVKSLESGDDNVFIENKWREANIDYVIYFSRSSNWGYITPAFSEARRRLNSAGHLRFHQHQKPFAKAFNKA